MSRFLRLSVCGLLSAFAAAPEALAQQAGEVVRGPRPPYTAFAPPEAVDHIVVLAVSQTGPPRTELVTVTRSGFWQREDVRRNGGSSSQFSDFERGVSVNWFRGDDGREFLQASQDKPGGGRGDFIRLRTGETQRWAGETCEVWGWASRQPQQFALSVLSCVTRDGIELWQGYRGYDGATQERFHATEVQRRKVRPEEVRLPAEVLDWKHWRAGVATDGSAAGYEMTLSDDTGREIVLRRRGDWTLKGGDYPYARRLMLYQQHATLNFSENERERRLSLGRDSVSPESEYIFGKPVELFPRREETILGHSCTWHDTSPSLHDAGSAECRDADGVIFALRQSSRGTITLAVRATRFSPKPPSEEAFTPPPETFSWVAG